MHIYQNLLQKKIYLIIYKNINMGLIIWNDDFSVNVEEIDNQHKKLVEMMNNLHNAMKDGKGNNVIGEIINKMIDYSIYHFSTEEKYFDMFNFPQKEQHKQVHKDFVEKVTAFKKDFENNKVMLTIEIMDFLSNWLQNHILGDDMEYSDFFVENGLS